MAFKGFVDQWAPMVRGWVINEESPDVPVNISLLVDGQVVMREIASQDRPDVAEIGYPSDTCGFEFRIGDVVVDTAPHELSIVDTVGGNEIFRSPSRVCVNISRPILASKYRGLESVVEIRGTREIVKEKIERGSPVALVSTFRPPGCASDALLTLLDGLVTASFVVCVIDTSASIPSDARSFDLWIRRTNHGLDFASWHTGLEFFGDLQSSAKQILLVNDSCYGPFAPLKDVLLAASSLSHQVVSLTDGWMGGHHLQSNFLLFKEEIVRANFLANFFAGYDFPIRKNDIVKFGEIALSRHLREASVDYGAIFPYQNLSNKFIQKVSQKSPSPLDEVESIESEWDVDVLKRLLTGEPLNTTHCFWEILIEEGFPFLKRDLLTKNPMGCPSIRRAGSLLRSRFGYENLGWIRSDLEARGSVPVLF